MTNTELRTHLRTLLSCVTNIECDCIDAPWHYDDYDPANPEHDENSPENHSQYCRVYLAAYIRAILYDTPIPA